MDVPLVNAAVLAKVKGWRPYVEAKLGFRNYWYPALFSSELEEGKPVEATLLGESILINRVDGVAYAIRNRCLHRGVKFSRRLECHSTGTITCWYHAFAYDWKDGQLVDIITNPSSALIGKHKLQAYAVRRGPGPGVRLRRPRGTAELAADVPPGFLDVERTIHGKRRVVKSNWRLGVENGFDASHIFIHKGSPLCAGNDIALPLGFAPTQPGVGTRPSIGTPGPIGLYDLLGGAPFRSSRARSPARPCSRATSARRRWPTTSRSGCPACSRSIPGRRKACSSMSGMCRSMPRPTSTCRPWARSPRRPPRPTLSQGSR